MESDRQPFLARVSVEDGNVIQATGALLGMALIRLAARRRSWPAMLLGWLAIYLCTHSIAHYAVGRLVGIRFRGYGIRAGTEQPENYPPGLRQVMQALPLFSALTDRTSMAQAAPQARTLMYAAGDTSTAVCSVWAAWYAWRRKTPGAAALLGFAVMWNAAASVAEVISPKGDYARALRVLKAGRAIDSPWYQGRSGI